MEDPWVELWLLPWPHGRPEDRQPILVGTWPLEVETAALADAQAVIAVHDDTPR